MTILQYIIQMTLITKFRHRLISFIGLLLIFQSAFGQSQKSDFFFSQGVELYNHAQYQEAIPFFERAVELDQKEISPESERYGYSSIWLACCYYKLGNVRKAREISPSHYSFEPVDRRLTVESDKEADLAIRLQQEGKIEEAIQHAINCLQLEKAELGEFSLHCAGSYLTIGNLYAQIGDNNNALAHYSNGLAILSLLDIDKSIFNFHLLMGRVYAYLSGNDIQSALTDMKSLESISDYEKNENNDAYPAALVDLLYARVGLQNHDYERATKHAESAFQSLLAQYSPTDEEKFISLTDCVTTLIMLSRYEVLIPLLQEAIEHTKDNRGHKGVLLSFLAECNGDISTCQESLGYLSGSTYADMYHSTKCMLANLYKANGEILKAIEMYKQVCDYYVIENSQSSVYRNALMSLGEIYGDMGDYAASNDYYKQILNLLANDKKSPSYVLTFMRWFPIYAKYSATCGRFNENNGYLEGYELGQELEDVLLNVRISDFLNEGIGMPTIANVMMEFFQVFFQNARMTYNTFWYDMERVLSQLTYDYLVPLCTDNAATTHRAKAALAHAKYLLGKYDDAIKLMGEVITSCKSLNFPYENYLHDLAYYQYDSGDKNGAFENFKVGYDLNKNRILSGYRWMTIDERNKLTRAFRGNLDNMSHYAAITPEDTRYAELGYDALLFTKGLLLNSTIELSRLLQEEGNKAASNLLNKWRKMAQEYQDLQQKGLYDQAINLKERIDNLERELIATSKSYGDYTDGLTVSYAEVQANLREGDIAVEFFSYQKDANSSMYGALVLTKSQSPRYVAIGLDREWGKLIENCYADNKLFNTLFYNLKPYFPSEQEGTIYFSADGLLHTIAIENLPGSEPYNFKRLSSTREIALNHANDESIKHMVVIGGVKYGIGSLADLDTEEEVGDRGALNKLSYLPGTRIEARKVCQLFAHKMNVDSLMAEKATETNFKKLSGQRIGVLHVGTHGFFHQPSDIKDPSMFESEVMKSSGLFFAGAQNTLWNEQEHEMQDDGILTAQEISMLDLRGLKLSVLSACETGKGSVGPDGVFGLQRGFKQAGAEGIMMSLWKVDDQATQILMEEFYRQLLKGTDPYAALREAQNRVREEYPDPKFWAAFILIDAIRKLQL